VNKIRIALIEDDPGWIKAMVSFLNKEDDIIVVGIAMNKNDGINLAKNLQIDIFLVDINLKENNYDGIYAAVEILEATKCKIIMLSCVKDEKTVADSFAVGAVNFISKEDYEDIPKVIRTIYSNSFSPVEVLAKKYVQLKKEEHLHRLTFSEREVFDLIEQGYTRSQIGEKLSKTANTLKTQIKKILGKLHVNSSKEAVRKIKFNGILDDVLDKNK
jgi:DNA-binding NarL/FixJ family response regulator